MKGKVCEIFITIAVILFIVLLSIFVGFSFGSKETNIRYKDTISNLRTENNRLAELLDDSQGTIGEIQDSIYAAGDTIRKLVNGTEQTENAIDASIRITGELNELYRTIIETIEYYEEGPSP